MQMLHGICENENGGLILGPYEYGAPVCYIDSPDANSEYELFQEDIERLTPHIETAIARVPAFGEVGVKKVYNGCHRIHTRMDHQSLVLLGIFLISGSMKVIHLE